MLLLFQDIPDQEVPINRPKTAITRRKVLFSPLCNIPTVLRGIAQPCL